MSLATIKLDESNKLEFGVAITGADGIPETRLVIESPKYSISFPCQQTNGGVEAVISEMKSVLPAGEYPIRMEVIIDNKIYTPFRDTITFEPLVEIVTTPKATTKAKKEVQETLLPTQEEKALKIEVTAIKPQAKTMTVRESKQLAMAKLVAKNLGFAAQDSQTPTEIIEHALRNAPVLSEARKASVGKLLKLAEAEGVVFDASVL